MDRKAKAQKAKAARAAKKAEKKRLREEMLENEPVDDGKINKVGASIVAVIACGILICIIFGTNSLTYSVCVKDAKRYFSNQQYSKAYMSISGRDIKQSDKKIYDKIMTVMYVEKQYESYQNYFNIEMYPEALNSLIKGLQKYNEYKKEAVDLNITGDMDYIKGKIEDSLEEEFSLSKKEVENLLSMKSKQDYKKAIYKLAGKK